MVCFGRCTCPSTKVDVLLPGSPALVMSMLVSLGVLWLAKCDYSDVDVETTHPHFNAMCVP